MEESDEGDCNKLVKRAKRMKIDDEDLKNWEEIKSAFSEHWYSQSAVSLPGSGQVIYSDLSCNEESILCGLNNGNVKVVDPNRLSESGSKGGFSSKHSGLSSVRCSNVSPEIFYTSSASDGKILLWDSRENSRKAVQNFDISKDSRIGGGSTKSSTKPILHFDVSQNDQVICGGTELVEEDSYLLFWDVRSSNLLGAYWESHSDDVTAVRFHPSQTHSLATGSTDGLVNVFNLLESSEDDALIFSLNTESSVDSVNWSCSHNPRPPPLNIKPLPSSLITCVTHSNEVQLWDAELGDRFANFSRSNIADTMLRSNPDAVYVNGSYQKPSESRLGILTCSLSGSCSRFINITDEGLKPSGLFCDQYAVIQTAQFMPKSNKWITFDGDGVIKTWALQSEAVADTKSTENQLKQKKERKEKNQHRLKPYSKEKSFKE